MQVVDDVLHFLRRDIESIDQAGRGVAGRETINDAVEPIAQESKLRFDLRAELIVRRTGGDRGLVCCVVGGHRCQPGLDLG